jgi:hypothetical protein
MNKTLKLAFSALLGAAMVVPALAQGEQFPDVPENHWVYQALLNMKNEGILVGYPDEMFRGGRPASRYELAGAINAAFQKLKGLMNGMQSQIDALKGMTQGGDPEAMAALRRELDALKAQLASMSRYGDDIDALKRMAATFERDLAAIGVDVEAMKRDMADLADRVKKLEDHKPAIDVHGDVNMVMHAGHRSSGFPGITPDLRITGFPTSGGVRDLTFGHELALEISGTNDTGPKWHGTVVVGNLLGGTGGPLYGNQNVISPGAPFTESIETVYIHDLVVNFGTSLVGQGFGVEMGRIGHQAGSYFMERQDTTLYFENDRWDDGNYYFDGVNLGFDWGAIDLGVYAGKPSSQTAVGGGPFRQMTAGVFVLDPLLGEFTTGGGTLTVNQMLGADLGIGLGSAGDIMLHYIFLDGVAVPPIYNRVEVYGGEVNFDIGNNIGLNGGYSQTDYGINSTTVNDDNNTAWWAQVALGLGSLDVNLGYKSVELFFGAPGNWGREGFFWNPVNVEGLHGDISFNMGNVGVNIGAYHREPVLGATINPTAVVPLTEYTGINAELNFNIFSNWAAMLGWEHVTYDFAGGDFEVNWYRLGLSQMMDANSTLMFKYEMSDFDGTGGQIAKGGFFTTQWSRKF